MEIAKVFAEAIKHLNTPTHGWKVTESDCQWFSWPQTWGSTAGDSEGIGGQMITSGQTFVVIGPCYDAVVLHLGSTYRVENPSDSFYADMHTFNLASKRDAKRRKDYENETT